MKQLLVEVQANFRHFSTTWRSEAESAWQALAKEGSRYFASYRRLVSLQAWRDELLSQVVGPDALGFFLEAQNDALVSHVLARFGSWRAALSALRGCVENVSFCVYYMDHPVELELWHLGRHRLGFQEIHEYLTKHPALVGLPLSVTNLGVLRKEYGLLSTAVHGSAKSFRMTKDGQSTALWEAAKASAGAWSTRESQTVLAVNMLLLCLFRDQLQGSRLPNLRKAVSLAVPKKQRDLLRRHVKVNLHDW